MSANPQLTLDDYKRFALQQAASAPSVNPVASALQMAAPPSSGPSLNPAGASDGNAPPSQGPMPQAPAPTPTGLAAIADPNAPPTATVTNVQQHQGPIKSFLSQFLYGAGQAMTAHVGLQTDAQKQQVAFNQQQAAQQTAIRQQGANDTSAYRQAQTGGLQAKADLLDAQNQPFTIPNDPSVPASLRGQTTTVGNWQALSKVFAANQGKTDVQGLRNDGSQAVADTRADASTANANIAAQVREDIAHGNLAMAGARLRLAQAKASGQLGGSSPTAMRLNKADLANNAQHNLGNAIGIINNSPDLFGKVAGHYTTAEQMIGSDDPRIQQLGNELHAAAQASGGVHGMRSAEAVKDTEKMWLNGFRNSPQATIAGLQAQSDSLNDYINFANYGKQAAPKISGSSSPASPSGGVIEYVRDSSGKLVRK